eukprot:TCALIF_06230-PA protein Name:"Similar to nas-39 Zinc metalloproteinase nas-39 (Caenorhabditis elegans)" AED:0.13 eAED:0.18 QI:46/0.33/0.25/1/0.66/0.5/4/0/334
MMRLTFSALIAVLHVSNTWAGNETFLTPEDMERARATLASGNFLAGGDSELACSSESRREERPLDRVYDANVLRHWPGGIVPYKFISNTFTNNAKDVIAQAIAHIEQNSCIQIRPATPSDVHYVGMTNEPNGCYASLGFSEGKGFQNQHHTYNLSPGGCDVYRDDFVFINWINIESGKEHNFFKTRSPTTPASVPICNSGPTSSGPDFSGCTTSSVTDTYGFAYDYQSVMHYSKTAFAVSNSVQTITPIPTASVTVGNNVGMSPLDISKLNAAYNCPNRSPSSSCDMSLIGTMGTLDQSTAMDGCEIFITVPVGHTIEFFFTDFNVIDVKMHGI